MRIAFCLLMLLATSSLAAETATARDCRVPLLPGKSAPKPPPGCDESGRRDGRGSALKRESGFVDLGNGTRVKIGGRVRLDTRLRP